MPDHELDPRDTPDLLRAAAEGDAAAWEALVRAYTGRLYGLLLSQCRDPELSEELTQATFVKVVQQLKPGRGSNSAGYREQGRFEPWLFRVAMNGLRDEMRRRKRQATPTDLSGPAAAGGAGLIPRAAPDTRSGALGEDPAQAVARAEELDWLRDAVATLPEADRTVLHLRHTAQLSFKEIAETLGEPLGTVLARGHRALGKLKKLAATA